MKAGWRTLPFSDVFADASGGNRKTPQSEFLDSGRFAIVDQGKSLIAGYTDDDSRLCQVPPPVIVFGDHTRCLKYVDFPFCMGADGVKVLSPKVEADVRYLFHYLRQLRLPDAGYARHYKYLKSSVIQLPPLPEQKRIASVLEHAQALARMRQSALEATGSVAQALFAKMFGDPLANVRGFDVYRLEELVDAERPITYGILKPGPDQPSGVNYVRVADMKDGGIDLGGIRKTTEAISGAYRRSVLAPGDLLMSIRGHVGRMATVPGELAGANITQDSARLAVVGASPTFVRECLRAPSVQRWMAKHTKGIAVQGINLGDVKKIPVIAPPRRMQEQFAEKVANVENLLSKQRRSAEQIASLGASLQYRAFVGAL